MKQGQVEKSIIETCIKRNQPLPDAIQNAPQLWQGLNDLYVAFSELSTCRDIAGGGPVPWTAMNEFAKREEMDYEEYRIFLYTMRKMDEAWLTYQKEKRENARRD